jgi:glycosyltransferase involved in cell wall biosynthesis
MERTPSVAVVFHHIGPYHHARLNASADRLSVTGVEWSAKGHDPWGEAESSARYNKLSLFPEATNQYPEKGKLRRAFSNALEQASPDIVAVNGWNNFGSLIATDCCIRHGIPMVVMSESARQDEPRTGWKEMAKRRIVALYSAALVGGQRHVDYLVELGMPRDRIFTGYDVVDNRYFRQKAEEVRNQTSEVRQKYALPENYFLASARFVEKKNLPKLIKAYAKYRIRSESGSQKSEVIDGKALWELVLLGDGPLKTDLCRLISNLRLNEHVHLPGFKQYEELPVYYGLAKAFVHASTTEQWGLVVNEAIASGLPVIVSNRCGCAPELVNGNGFTFDPGNRHELVTRLLQMASLSDKERKHLGDNSCRIAGNFAPERFGEGLQGAMQVALSSPRKASLSETALLKLLS